MEYKYKEHQKEIIFNNNDRDLVPIHYKLPDPPLLEMIDGYGKAPEDQRFEYQKMPKRLRRLEDDCTTIEDVHQILRENQILYKDEIKWIKLQWKRRLYGYWFFNNGTPTYIDGHHYFYVNYWGIGNNSRSDGLPDYRDRDRRFFLFARMCWDDPRCYGMTYPKHRREGATFKAQAKGYCIVTEGYQRRSGIQSMTDTHAEEVFLKKLVEPWKELPFFFKPLHDGSTNPKKRLNFVPVAIKSTKGSAIKSDKGLRGGTDYRSASVGAYDSYKLYFSHQDEVGKRSEAKPVDVSERWNVNKKCLAQYRDIHGMAMLTSTVGKMEGGGGKQFDIICRGSHYEKRNDNGETKSGLYNLFIPGYDGLDGYVDTYGNSIIEDPEEPVLNSLGEMMDHGAKSYIQRDRQGYIDLEDWEGLDETTRLVPINFRECFRPPQRESGFDIKILHGRMDDLRQNNTHTKRVNFEFKNGRIGADVVMVDEPERGRFIVSQNMPQGQANKRFLNPDDGQWTPFRSDNIAGADPFAFNKAKSEGAKSSGAGIVFRMHDPIIDREDKPKHEWVSNQFICTYLNKTVDKAQYSEDMLAMCVYYRAMMYPEQNVPFLYEFFEDNDFAGYLIYDIDKYNGKQALKPGVNVSPKVKQRIFQLYMQYIKHHGSNEKHLELLEEVAEIGGIDEMTYFDLFSAGGYALLGVNSMYHEINAIESENTDIGDWF